MLTRHLATGVFVLVLATGCGGSPADSLNDHLLLRSADATEGEMDARIGGTLSLDEERGCVLLSGNPVVWPAGTTVTSEPLQLHLPSGLTATSGDTIAGDGGELPAAELDQTEITISGDVSAALQCAPANAEATVFTAKGTGLSVSRG